MLLNKLLDDKTWLDFLDNKTTKAHIPEKELKYYADFIEKKKYKEIVEKIVQNDYTFSTPKKILISKMGKSKKRVVYRFNEEENMVLKVLSHLLYKYDYLFCPNLYSFRKNNGVKKAILNLTKKNNLRNMYGYKLDISNYFNSISVSKLLPNLKQDLNDNELFEFFAKILSNPYVCYNGELLQEQKGIMAGVPISSFLANYYLKDMDNFFYSEGIVYARYADDIILFANSESDLNIYKNKLHTFLKNLDLKINSDKEFFYLPGEKFDFLGFSYENGIIDLSDNTIMKIKGKIRRSARGIRRWMLKKDAKPVYALKAMNRKYNRKFYGKNEDDLTWKYWFFPVINTSKSLKLIDLYMQDYLRFIVTGKHNKKNFEKVPYDLLKQCNYRPLVYEYYL